MKTVIIDNFSPYLEGIGSMGDQNNNYSTVYRQVDRDRKTPPQLWNMFYFKGKMDETRLNKDRCTRSIIATLI